MRFVPTQLTQLCTSHLLVGLQRTIDQRISAAKIPGWVQRLVDVVGGPRAGRDGGAILAPGARVLAVLPGESSSSGPVVLVALPGPVAARVAAATIGQDVTVTLR